MHEQAITHIFITAIMIAILVKVINRVRSRRNKQTPDQHVVATNTYEWRWSHYNGRFMKLPPLIDSKLLQVQVIIIILLLPLKLLATDVFHSTKITSVLHDIIPYLIVSSSVTLIMTILIRACLMRKREYKNK